MLKNHASHKSFHWFWYCFFLLFPKLQIQSWTELDSVFFMFIIVLLQTHRMLCWKSAWQVFLIWRENTRRSCIACKLVDVIFFFFPFCKTCSHFQHRLLADGISMRKSRYRWSRLFTVQLSTLLPLSFLCVRKCTNNLQIQQYPKVLLILSFCLPLYIVILHIAYHLLASQDRQNHLGTTLLWWSELFFFLNHKEHPLFCFLCAFPHLMLEWTLC